jgi:hypothetical protein
MDTTHPGAAAASSAVPPGDPLGASYPEDAGGAQPTAQPTGGAAKTLPRPPVRSGPGLRPALIVVGIAIVVLLLFGIGAAVSNTGTGTPTRSTTASSVPGSPLLAVPGAAALRPIEQPGSPPGNILDAVSIPQGSAKVSVIDTSGSVDQYDESMVFSVPASQAELIGFFRTEMARAGWNVFSSGPATGQPGIEVLGQKAGNDGWYWEMGAIVRPTQFASNGTTDPSAGTQGSAGGSDTTQFVIRLFQVPDPA